MVKRIACVTLLFLLLLLSACGEQKPVKESFSVDSALRQAVLAHNEKTTLSTAFAFDMAKQGEEQSLVFTQGTLSYKVEKKTALSGRVTQVSGGNGVTSNVYYKAGAYYNDNGSSKYYVVMDKDEVLKTLFCVPLPVPEDADISAFRKAQTSGGTKYVYTAKAKSAEKLFESNLYGYCGMRKPVREETKYHDAEFCYVVDGNGALKSFKVSVSVTLRDTAPYYPNYQVPISQLEKSFDLSFELTVKGEGADVVIEEPKVSDFTFLG